MEDIKDKKGQIAIYGAREHNLKNIDLTIPRNSLVVITGLSGSGKSSLAFDTIYAEGQRRYMETLSAYARQFLGNMERPDVRRRPIKIPALQSAPRPKSTISFASSMRGRARHILTLPAAAWSSTPTRKSWSS